MLPGTWHYGVSTGTIWPVVSILWMGETEILIYNFYLRVAEYTIVWADTVLGYTNMLLVHLATNKQQPSV